jgi:hypothetical protein
MFKQFKEQEVIDTYHKFVKKPKEYYQKLSPLPLHLNNKRWKWEGKDFPRVPCVLDFSEWVLKHNLSHVGTLLSTCTDDPELDFITYDNILNLPYDGNSNDLHKLTSETKVDFVIFNQTIEHLYNPFISMHNLYNILKEGGYLFTSVPTINIPHMVPFHYNGYTPIGLCMLMKSVGFEIVELGYWGNYNYLSKLLSNQNWPSYENLIDENNNITNDPNNTAQCWVLVKK